MLRIDSTPKNFLKKTSQVKNKSFPAAVVPLNSSHGFYHGSNNLRQSNNLKQKYNFMILSFC